MEPWMSWVLFGTGVAAAGGYYYTQSQKKIARAREVAGRRRGPQARVEPKERRIKARDSTSSDPVVSDFVDVASATGSGAEGSKKRKGNKKQPSKLIQSSAVDVSNEPKPHIEGGEDEGMDNTEFARQFSSKQMGTDLKKSASPAKKQRTKKQSKHNKTASEATNGSALMPGGTANPQPSSTASSTTGADADDDLSPTNSPELGAMSNTMSSGMDVSDMLEAPMKGPSILNITAPTKPQHVRQPKQQKPVPEPETKKQRQNRKKKEEQRTAREESEKERRVLLEKQLRTAREAEGRPAKNGLGITNAPPSNAWNKTATVNGGPKAPPPLVDQNDALLLDTFDDGQSSANGATSLSALAVNGGSSPQAASASTFTSNTDLPSEEEQLRLISEMDSDNVWNTVNKGGKAKRTKAAIGSSSASNNMSSPNNVIHKQGNQRIPSKFAALDVEHSTEESTNLDREEEVAAIAQKVAKAKMISHSTGDDSDHMEEATSFDLMETTSTNDPTTMSSTNTPANDIRSYTTTAGQSVTGFTIPDHVHPRPHELWITKDTPAEALPQGWYHYDNGCRYGNAKIPHSDREYERELQKHIGRALDGQLYPYDHRMKATLEKSNYDKCLLIYRAHIARTIDFRKWNKDNIKEHLSYEHDWPWALLPHPSEGWSAGFHDERRDCNICEAFSR